MPALLLDGRLLAKKIEADLSARITRLRQTRAAPIKLATILVGDDPASATYVKMKGNACRRVGLEPVQIDLPQSTTTQQLLAVIENLNRDGDVFGILLQHPVPAQIDERSCFDAIDPAKDTDGVTALGFGRLCMNVPAFGSATPAGIMGLLKHYDIALAAKHAVVVGRSAILGKPMAAMLLNADATVTICHSRTQQLREHVQRADLIIGAVGKPHFIAADWIRDGAIMIDAGYHPGGIGDIDPSGIERWAAYTPVPGGVGPMTIATLLANTVAAAERF